MYKVEIRLKQGEPLFLETTDLESLTKSLQNSQIIWFKEFGIWINPTEMVQIRFQKISDEQTPCHPCNTSLTPDEAPEDKLTMSPACGAC